MSEVWMYRITWDSSRDVTGYEVEAVDGDIGKISDASHDTGRNWIVVDTGFWIFGKKRLIPAGVVDRVDHDDRKVYVSMSKDEIKKAPDYEELTQTYDDSYFDNVGGYYERPTRSR